MDYDTVKLIPAFRDVSYHTVLTGYCAGAINLVYFVCLVDWLVGKLSWNHSMLVRRSCSPWRIRSETGWLAGWLAAGMLLEDHRYDG